MFVFRTLQIPLAPQRILCGPQELIIKKCNQDIRYFSTFPILYSFQLHAFQLL
jgi:hypothetical protein